MNVLPPPDSPRVVLSFDFDGTLHDPSATPPVPLEFFERIRQLREEKGAMWGINTGRSMMQMMEGFIESRFPFLPDWVVAREREIHFPNAFGRWVPLQGWNKLCEKEIHKLFKRSRKILKNIRKEIEENTGARWLEMEGEPAGLIAQSEEEMEWIVTKIIEFTHTESQLAWQRNSIYLRFGHRDFQKGSSLTHVALQYGLTPEHCFAIGDSHNDFEMLAVEHAGMAACPANAVDAIRESIIARGGLVTRTTHAAGALEALQHYFGSNS